MSQTCEEEATQSATESAAELVEFMQQLRHDQLETKHTCSSCNVDRMFVAGLVKAFDQTAAHADKDKRDAISSLEGRLSYMRQQNKNAQSDSKGTSDRLIRALIAALGGEYPRRTVVRRSREKAKKR